MTFTELKSKSPNPDLPQVFDVSPQDVFKQMPNLELIDVRRPDEFTGELGHVPGSRLIVLDTLPDHLDEIPKNRTVIFICRSGARSARATAFALENGYTSVFNMKGGMIAWNEQKLNVEGRNS